MIGSSKNSTEKYPRKCFWTQEKETQVKFNPGLSVNPASNNLAQEIIFLAKKLILIVSATNEDRSSPTFKLF